jgi:hypothetical protein
VCQEPVSSGVVEDLVRKLQTLLRPTELVLDDQPVTPSRPQQEVAKDEVSVLNEVLSSFKVHDGRPSLELDSLCELGAKSEDMFTNYSRRSIPLSRKTYADCIVRLHNPFVQLGWVILRRIGPSPLDPNQSARVPGSGLV